MSSMSIKQYLDSLSMFGIKLGLDSVSELMRRAGNPDRDLKFIHLAGTNGKGSTGAMLECALRSAGFTTGFYSSPHLVDIRERFRVNGRAVTATDFETYAGELAEVIRKNSSEEFRFTYFEFTTVLAALIFARAGVDVVVWETGMGGRLDATNMVNPIASVITNIALDHQVYLGDTIEKIASEKAGIIKAGVPLFYGVMPEEAQKVLLERARQLGSPTYGPGVEVEKNIGYQTEGGVLVQKFDYEGHRIGLPLLGAMQRRNFRTVYAVLKFMSSKYGLDLNLALKGLSQVRWPARCQQLNERLFVDGGHNPDGLQALCEALSEVSPGEKFRIIFAGFKDKDVAESLREIAPLAAEFVFVPLHESDRPSYSGSELCTMAKGLVEVPCRATDNALLAVNEALIDPNLRVLVAGSLYLAGEVLGGLAEPSQVLDLV